MIHAKGVQSVHQKEGGGQVGLKPLKCDAGSARTPRLPHPRHHHHHLRLQPSPTPGTLPPEINGEIGGGDCFEAALRFTNQLYAVYADAPSPPLSNHDPGNISFVEFRGKRRSKGAPVSTAGG